MPDCRSRTGLTWVVDVVEHHLGSQRLVLKIDKRLSTKAQNSWISSSSNTLPTGQKWPERVRDVSGSTKRLKPQTQAKQGQHEHSAPWDPVLDTELPLLAERHQVLAPGGFRSRSPAWST